MKYAIVSKKDAYSHEVENKIRKILDENHWIYDEENPNLVICVGGDGTLLYALHCYIQQLDKINFLGIHTGTLGFFTDYTDEELDQCMYDILHKQPDIFTSSLLEIKLDNLEKPIYALNEMRVENIVKSQEMEIYIDGEYFETCKG